MKVEVAMQYADALRAAALKAMNEGRDELTAAELDVFAGMDDAARSELEAAIQRASS